MDQRDTQSSFDDSDDPHTSAEEAASAGDRDSVSETASARAEQLVDVESSDESAVLRRLPLTEDDLKVVTNPAAKESESDRENEKRDAKDGNPLHLATSTFLSLVMVLALLLLARIMVPSIVENLRYSWYKGQLRAEYELSGQELRKVSLDSLEQVSELVSQRVGPSVVHINVLQNNETATKIRSSWLGRIKPPEELLEGQGSGFVISSDGYLLTNHHVISDGGRLEVTLSDGRRMDATVVGADTDTDLAVLKIDAADLIEAQWGSSDDVVIGSPVWAVGSPFGLQHTVTFGIISGKHRVDFRGAPTSGIGQIPAYGDLMQSDVVLYPGNSGGPLANSVGDVVGVNAAILGDSFQGISFSIPSRVAKSIAEELIAKGKVSRGWLGIFMEDLPKEERFDASGSPLPGVRVGVYPRIIDSPARRAGIKAGDIIVKFDNRKVMGQKELLRIIGETEVGRTVIVEVRRGGETIKFDVLISERN